MNRKDRTIWRGCFSGLRITTFGRDQVLAGEYDVEVYQTRANPPRWNGAPPAGKAWPMWHGSSAAECMQRVMEQFETVVSPFVALNPDGSIKPGSPSPPRLNSAAEAVARRRNRLGA